MLKQTYIVLFSAILGSIFGLKSAFGGGLEVLEKQLIKRERTVNAKRKLNQAVNLKKFYNETNNKADTRPLIPQAYNKANSSKSSDHFRIDSQ